VDVALKKRIPWERRLLEVTDWPRTQAYSISNGVIFVNRRGRGQSVISMRVSVYRERRDHSIVNTKITPS